MTRQCLPSLGLWITTRRWRVDDLVTEHAGLRLVVVVAI